MDSPHTVSFVATAIMLYTKELVATEIEVEVAATIIDIEVAMATGIVAQANIIGVDVMGLAIRFTNSKNIEENIDAVLVDYSY